MDRGACLSFFSLGVHGRRRAAVRATTLSVLLIAGRASARNPLNSSDSSAARGDKHAADGGSELNVVPVVGGDTDIGFGGGAFLGFAELKRGYEPYLWNVDAAAMFTFEVNDAGRAESPLQDVYAKLTIPRWLDAPMTLSVRPSYTWERTLGYYGIGNASARLANVPDRFYQFDRLHPALDVDLKIRILDHFAGKTGFRYTQNWIDVARDSKLARDLATGTPELRALLGSTEPHAVVLLKSGLQWDDRDSEVSAHGGGFHEFDAFFSPGGAGMFPYRYCQLSIVSRVYVPLARALTLAGRVVVDALIGNAPFYELARFDDTYALGGANGVRGVPAQRYAGKLKLFGNFELRAEVARFRALSKQLNFGVVAFFDAGRLWSDGLHNPEWDGTTLGLKYGTGGGLRLQSGSTFVLRADLAWSPDAIPIGGYFGVGQMF